MGCLVCQGDFITGDFIAFMLENSAMVILRVEHKREIYKRI